MIYNNILISKGLWCLKPASTAQGLRPANPIRTDNGVPFACGNALYGLSRLSVWWLRLGINIELIKPGHPEQNGRYWRARRDSNFPTTWFEARPAKLLC